MIDITNIPKNLTSWVHPDLILRESEVSGGGLFATKKFKKGSKVSVFGGRVYTLEEMQKLPTDSYIVENATQLNNEFFLGPLDNNTDEWGFYINHSCNPNTKIEMSMFLVCIKDVNVGEEITFDYAHSHNKFLNFHCNCMSTNCRKYISDDDYLDEEFYNNNEEHIVWWLKELRAESKVL